MISLTSLLSLIFNLLFDLLIAEPSLCFLDTWVEQRIAQVYNEIDDHEKQAGHEDYALDKSIVTLCYSCEDRVSDAGVTENVLDADNAADERAHHVTKHCYKRKKRVSESILENNIPAGSSVVCDYKKGKFVFEEKAKTTE